jgi:hypothetical protein
MTASVIKLRDIAHARSGDKGNDANIAVIAYTEAGFAWLREHLTAEVVACFFRPRVTGSFVQLPAGGVLARGNGERREQPKTEGKHLAHFFPYGLGQNRPRVERYEAPNVRALNFVLRQVLAGGASLSLGVDRQGKTLGLALLELELPQPPGLEGMLRKKKDGADV